MNVRFRRPPSIALRILICMAPALGLMGAGSAIAAEDARPVFETRVQKIFRGKCGKCHGALSPKGELDLSTAAGVVRGGESGDAVVAGKLDQSLIWQRISDQEMPPAEAPQLTDAEKRDIRRWIESGARFAKPPRTRKLSQHDILPILYLRCVVCHGNRRREGGLDLRSRASILRGGKSGPAAIPGKPRASRLIQRIEALEMPPRRQLVKVSVKPMEAAELERLRRWIAAGLPETNTPADVATTKPDPLVSDAQRTHWAFQPPRVSPPPTVRSQKGTRNPIDAYLRAALARRQLTFNPPAPRRTLLRRLYLDLIGLPPAPREVAEFVADTSPDAYERVVDRLLSSPRYGERWGRHWLDAAGYADSEGAQNEDRVRPDMYRYRDYVIRAFNADKPYDRMLHEQLAGDELAAYEKTKALSPELYDNLVATGFLRTAPDRTFAGITNFVPDRLEVIADEIQVFSSAVLGLTMHCARCHTHKFDPIPQRDYYRLAATLKDALDEHDWLGPGARKLTHVAAPERHAYEQAVQGIDKQVQALQQQLKAAKDDKPKRESLQKKIAAIKGQKPREPMIRALWSRGDPSPTYILKRGNYLRPGREVGPGVPSVLTDGRTPFVVKRPWPGSRKTGRRLALARWLCEPRHPLTARVLVNRIWMHHFGRGIVRTPGNFGVTSAPPTHPELLDFLAVTFVRDGWSIKRLHRRIVTSTAYRQSSRRDEQRAERDPDGRWLSHMPLRRLDAEILRDSLVFVAGKLRERPFGPPDDVDVGTNGLVVVKKSGGGWRRSIYALHRRTKLPTLLENFDSPQMSPNCVQRGESIVATQALHLLNNGVVFELAEHFADRIHREVGSDPPRQIEHLYRVALARPPEPEERREALAALDRFTRLWQKTIAALPAKDRGPRDAKRRALTNLCHAIMNSAAFAYVD